MLILFDLLLLHVLLRLTELLLDLLFDQIWVGHMKAFDLYLLDLFKMKAGESFQFRFKFSFRRGKQMKGFNLLV